VERGGLSIGKVGEWYVESQYLQGCSLSSTEAWLKPTASLVGLEENLDTDPQIGQLTCVDCVGSPFSQEQ
jgi:hypothetical protein